MTSEITNRVSANVTGNKKQRLFVAKKLINSQKYFVSTRQKKVSHFLSKSETFLNTKKIVIFSSLACLIVGRRGRKGAGGGG